MLHRNIRGKSLHAPSSEIVENNTGSAVGKLRVVALNGMGNLFPQVTPSNPLINETFGITQDTIDSGKFGYVTCIGFMFDVDTSAWPAGSELYSDLDGNLTTVLNGGIVAIVVKSDATQGVLYVGGPMGTFRDASWSLNGNVDIDEDSHFIGNRDNKDLRFKTDDTLRLNITKYGWFGFNIEEPAEFIHIKAHAGYPNSGKRITTFGVQTNNSSWNTAYSWDLPESSVAMIKVTAIGKTTPGSYAVFVRTVTFRRSGMVGILGPTQSDYTDKTSPNYEIRFSRYNSTLFVEIKSAVPTATSWTGTVEIEVT